MIDVENDVFSYVATALRTEYPNIFVASEYVDFPSQFPAVTIMENDNHVYERMSTTAIEDCVKVMYECNVYSNITNGKKQQAKAIAATMDSAFLALGFTRTMKSQINLNDATIFRIVCRYEAVVAPNGSNAYMIYQS